MRNIIDFSLDIVKIAIRFSTRKPKNVRFFSQNEDFGLGYVSVFIPIFLNFEIN